ncbi:MAG: hypothetical protein ACYCPN_06265 [Thermoplasmata archaeon]
MARAKLPGPSAGRRKRSRQIGFAIESRVAPVSASADTMDARAAPPMIAREVYGLERNVFAPVALPCGARSAVEAPWGAGRGRPAPAPAPPWRLRVDSSIDRRERGVRLAGLHEGVFRTRSEEAADLRSLKSSSGTL